MEEEQEGEGEGMVRGNRGREKVEKWRGRRRRKVNRRRSSLMGE